MLDVTPIELWPSDSEITLPQRTSCAMSSPMRHGVRRQPAR